MKKIKKNINKIYIEINLWKIHHMYFVVLVLMYGSKMYETYVSGSFDITSGITVDMDWKGSQVSTLPYYPNNLINPPQDIVTQMKKLQTYQADLDGPTDSTYVSACANNQLNIDDGNNLDNVNNLEGFTTMNPYMPNH